MACRNLKEKRTKEIGGSEFDNKKVFACMFLVFHLVFKGREDPGMLIRRREGKMCKFLREIEND